MTYQHKPLDLSKAQIRLLRLDFSPNSNSVNVEVEHFDFNGECPEYEAVSYTWGEKSDSSTIRIQGQRMTVGENLYRLLKILQTEDQGWLWIDQICIDQKNPNERNHQVRMMHQIYTRASGVIAWLGASGENSDEAMHCIANYDKYGHSSHYKDDELSSFEEYRALIQFEAMHNDKELGGDPDHKRRSHKPTRDLPKDTQSAILALVQRPYWSRLWILQEVIAAKKVDLMCGRRRIDWSCFERFLQVYYQFCINHYPAFKKSHTIVDERSAVGARKLLPLLQRFTDWQCKDNRDKIYGLVGLVSYDIELVIDYKKSTEVILYDAINAVYEDLKGVTDSTQPWGSDRVLWNIVNIALQLRRNLSLFQIRETELLKRLLHEHNDLWREAISYAGASLDASPNIVCQALLENNFLRDQVINEQSLARGLKRRRSFNTEYGEPSTREMKPPPDPWRRGNPNSVMPDEILAPKLAGLDINDPQVLVFYTELIDFKASFAGGQTYSPKLKPHQRQIVYKLARILDLEVSLFVNESGQRQVRIYKPGQRDTGSLKGGAGSRLLEGDPRIFDGEAFEEHALSDSLP